MSYRIGTDLLSMLERRNAPPIAVRWIQRHEAEIFLSVVSLAELQFGVDHAPATHKPSLAAWLSETRRKFAPATEELTEAVVVRWKKLILALKQRNRTMTCEDSSVAGTALYHGHIVATHNTRHFEPSGVQIVGPLA